MYSLRLPTNPPVVQVRRAPREPNIPSETYMRDRISTSGAGLFSNPGLRNAPSLGQFFRGQYFEEWPSCCFVVLRLLSTHILCLCFNSLHSTAVLRTAVRHMTISFGNRMWPIGEMHLVRHSCPVARLSRNGFPLLGAMFDGKPRSAQHTSQSVRVETSNLFSIYAPSMGPKFYSRQASCASGAMG